MNFGIATEEIGGKVLGFVAIALLSCCLTAMLFPGSAMLIADQCQSE